MKVKDLIALLSSENPEAEVRMALQPEYPHAHDEAGVASDAAVAETELEEKEPDEYEEGAARPAKEVVYVVQGQWRSYGSRAAWDAALRRRRA